jgi:multidrug efflux pump subunit AcrA (membrane-fusion protein)
VLVWLSPSSAGARPDLGRFGTALIRPGTQVRALAVPDSAILEDDLTGAHRVAAVDSSGHVAWLDVRPGPRDGDLRGVEGAGLAPGIRVIVAGQRALADGAEVDARP